MSKKERTLDQYRQSKEFQEQIPQIGSEGETDQLEEQVTGHNNPWDVHGNDVYRKSYQHDFKYQLKQLRKQYPNNQEFGAEVAKLL